MTRALFGILALGCMALLVVSLYFQFIVHLEPCPLCIIQRIQYMVITLISLIAFLHGPGRLGSKCYGYLIVLISILGIGVAGYQSWIQLQPTKGFGCGPDLSYLLENYSIMEVLARVFKGSGDCHNVDWSFLSLSMANWSVICFVCIMIYMLFLLYQNKHRCAHGSNFRN